MSSFSPKSLDLFQRYPFRFRYIEISPNNRQNSNERIEQEAPAGFPWLSPLIVKSVPGIENTFNILKKVNDTIALKNHTDNEPREDPSPLNFCGNTSDTISQPSGPILIAKNPTYKKIRTMESHFPESPNRAANIKEVASSNKEITIPLNPRK